MTEDHAVNDEESTKKKGARIVKIFSMGVDGKAKEIVESKQLLDPFAGVVGYGEQLKVPPFNLEQLVMLAESNPVHGAALEQKATDIVADGLNLLPMEGVENPDDEQKKDIIDWWESLFDEITSIEATLALWNDHETVGWGFFEVGRDLAGKVKKLWHIPGHTMRANSDGKRFAQMRNGKTVWFKLWGTEEDFLASDGSRVGKRLVVNTEKLANEVLVFRKPSRRSTWYGIPNYVSAIGHLALAVAARNFNIKFFDNYREPRHLIVITGLEGEVDQTISEIEKVWKEQLKDNPHHNIFIPIEGEAEVTIHKLGTGINDMHFARMMEQSDAEILVAHRMPPERIGIVKRGSLGGSVTAEINEIYKNAVVSPGQVVLESRLDRFVKVEYRKAIEKEGEEIKWKVDFEDLDVTDKKLDTDISIAWIMSNAVTINEGRKLAGMAVDEDKYGDKTFAEFLVGVGGAGLAASVNGTPAMPLTDADVREKSMSILGDLDDYVNRLMDAKEDEGNETE